MQNNPSQDIEQNTPEADAFIDYALSRGFGDIHIKIDPQTGMRAIIAIHSTKRGPALGGCRFLEYNNSNDAMWDAARLALGMSSKAALADLPLGGGKAVIIKPKKAYDREGYLQAFGRFVNELNGNYITALDSGTDLDDMEVIAQETNYVASRVALNGDPSPFTAEGTLYGIKAALSFQRNKEDLNGVHVAIQGIGHVGYHLMARLHQEGAKVTVADTNPELIAQAKAEFGVNEVPIDTIHKVPCDVFAPCALGGIINSSTIKDLQTTIVAGAANNQLQHAYHGKALYEKGILYAPDYVINSGGLILAASKYLNTPESTVNQKIEAIHSTLLRIFKRAQQEKKPTNVITDQMARELLE